MRLIALSVMGLMAGLGLAAVIVDIPAMAEKGPLRTTLVAHLGGGQDEVSGGGDTDGRGRAVVKVFAEKLCAMVEAEGIESPSSKATIHLGMRGEVGPTVANLQEQVANPTTGTTTDTTTGTTGTNTSTTKPTLGTTTITTGTTGAQTGTTTTTTGDSTLPQATTAQSTTVGQTSLSQSTASATASASASALAATSLEHTGGCVSVPRALSLALGEHPRRFYVNVTNGQSAEGAIRGQLHRSGHDDHRSGDGDDD
jgi:hypothetical protein